MINFENRILNCIPSEDTDLDWTMENAVEAELVDISAGIPESKDLRDDSWWTIDDQGNTGSCVGWAAANSVLRWYFVKNNRLSRTEKLSARYLWMASKETDNYTSYPTTFIENAGTRLKAALDIARKYGIIPESLLPFLEGGLYSGKPYTFYARAAQLKISSYFSLGRELRSWREWLALKGPILTRLNVDTTWYGATNNGGMLDSYRKDTAKGGHAVAIVGYTPDRFIIRNSWGKDWGDEGFAYASDSYSRDAFTEVYGVNSWS